MRRNRHISFWLGLFICLAWGRPTPGTARTMILDNPQRVAFSAFSTSLAVVGDVDGDHVPDYLVGAYNNRWGKNDRQGRAFVFSAKSGKLLFTIDDPEPQPLAAFGFAVASPGDINNDGIADFLIGAFSQAGDKPTSDVPARLP